MSINEKIVSLRKSKGMSQMEFAESVGVSRQSVSKWESGESLPDTDKIIAISSLFGVSTDYLLKDGNEADIQSAEINTEETDDSVSAELTGNNETNEPSIKKDKKKLIISAICVVAALGVFISSLFPGGFLRKLISSDNEKYPYVLVHGLGGWGDGSAMNNYAKYWGATTGDLAMYLNEKGYEVYTPSVGPLSSTWDRCCELYAVLTGSRVDYGEAHSKAHNHQRYGRTYSEAMISDFGEKGRKINLVGHSFGGETVRMFASLLEYGDKAEIEASKDDVSPLFTGGKGKLVHSVTTLCSPHNGSSLTCVLNSTGSLGKIDNTTNLLASLCFMTAGAMPKNGVYDFMLDQFGIGSVNGGYAEITKALDSFISSGDDHAGYELSPDGSAWLNKQIKMVDSAYYFSYSYSTTKKSSLFYTQVPVSDTLPILYPFALAMGSYNGKTDGGISIDSDWLENDGLVSVVSAKAPFGDTQTTLPENTDEIKKGIWNVAETKKGDHGTVIGLNADGGETHAFYEDLFDMIDSLRY